MSDQSKPASPFEAEEFANKAVADYLDACRISDRHQIGNYLMKLCSVVAVLMASAEGSILASERLEGTAAFVRKTMSTLPARLEKLQ